MATPNVLALASLTQKLLVSQQVTVTTETAIYTVPANQAVKLAQGSLCNTSGATVTVSLSLVASGGTAGATNRVISGFLLSPGDTLSLGDYLGGHMLGQGDFISLLCTTANAVAVVISGAVSA